MAQKAITSPPVKLTGIQHRTMDASTAAIDVNASIGTLSGIQNQLSGIPDVLTGVPQLQNHDATEAAPYPPASTVSGIQTDGTLPDLGTSKPVTREDVLLQFNDTAGDTEKTSVEPLFEAVSTEEELDAVDALLSLQTPRDNTLDQLSLDDNETLMPIRGNNVYHDVNPVPLQLDQVTVDNAIAQIIETEDALGAHTAGENVIITDKPDSDLSGIPDEQTGCDVVKNKNIDSADVVNKRASEMDQGLSGVPDNEPAQKSGNSDTKLTSPKKGAFKTETYGIKKKGPVKDRSYRCQVCGIRKRSAQSLERPSS